MNAVGHNATKKNLQAWPVCENLGGQPLFKGAGAKISLENENTSSTETNNKYNRKH
ncbi:MAG: hypothetical protein AB1782_10235 [Cyanobacteriota bacterium]